MDKSRRPRRKIQRVTLSDVAQMAGVSPSTVSLYLRQPEAVSAGASQIIQAAIQKLNYRPNLIARGLAAASSRVVSVIVPSVQNAFFAETVAALQRELGEAKLQLLLGHTEYNPRTEEELVRTALSWSPAALVIAGLHHSDATRKMLETAGVPVVEIWELGGTPVDMAVGFHHHQVGALTARHLASRGYENLVYLSGRTHLDTRADERARGFLAAAEALGLPARHLSHPAPATVECGGILLSQLVDEYGAAPGTGIGCSNDLIALGALFEAQRRGLRIPQDFSVVGFGDLGFSASSNPSLSTIRPFGNVIGLETARLIKARLNGEEVAPATVIDTGFTLLHRQSS
ncbi:LacI family DNA-binding transcriptional regulator [Paracoccus sp. (in: a-proteobacteria)]|uniref:LacI family DNA-binding transcriptional regulator n=1 Tax=Paracoccus sp. TaxID=267 RepID=UPI00289F898C|nr:LacI family DNA-binding transcriptional regulator [Paracoccus sp. (in: a-proteobacteria)]